MMTATDRPSGIFCGHCKGRHSSVGGVRDCYESGTARPRPATVAQQNFAQALYKDRVPLSWQSTDEDQARRDIQDMDFDDISEYIGKMKVQPFRPKQAAKVRQAHEDVPDGMYKVGNRIFKVQIAVHGSGRPYAKELIVRGHGSGDFVRCFDGIRVIRDVGVEQARMSLEEAQQFGRLYGVCCKCGRTLTDEGSIAAGIGPVCAAKGW